MEVTCSFKKITGGVCGLDKRYPVEIVVLLSSCQRDIASHIRSVGILDVETEVELILARASVFSFPRDFAKFTICPVHRSSLGIGWRRTSNRCRAPAAISTHAAKGTTRKAARGLSKNESKAILQRTGVFIPAGSGICRDCKPLLKSCTSSPSTNIERVTEEIANVSLNADDREPQAASTPFTPRTSFYVPSGEDTTGCSDVSFDVPSNSPLEDLNIYLASRDISPVRSRLRTPWEHTSERTKRYYTRKIGQGAVAMLKDITPDETGPLYSALCSSNMVQQQLSSEESDVDSSVDQTLLQALADCYQEASNWEVRRQILSIMADKVRYSILLRYIPGLTRYRFTEAKRHCLTYGRGAPVQSVRSPRKDVSSAQIQHFISFITSSHVVQDLPFGERSIKLSNKDTIKIPNIIRTIVPERMVKQYLAYCTDSGFKPLSRSTLLRILAVCPASTRKSLQGLDYVTSAGAEAFDDLLGVVERLGDAGQGARFTDKQKAFLTAKFRIGEETGIKSDPTAVARSMMFAKDPDGSLIFKSDDFLTSKQIAGFFSRLAAKKTLQDDVLIEDVEIAVHEAELEAFAREVEQELTLNHPIVFEAYNLCELNVKKKLDMFSMSVLINICSQFGIDTTDIKSKRVKKPYVSKLQSLCQDCECQQ